MYGASDGHDKMETAMERYELERDGRVPLAFNGELLASVSSRADQRQKRWQELEVYRTEAGAYVLNRVGYSDMPGEVDYHFAFASTEPTEIIDAMRHQGDDGVRFLTRLARDLIDELVAIDPRFEEDAVEEIA